MSSKSGSPRNRTSKSVAESRDEAFPKGITIVDDREVEGLGEFYEHLGGIPSVDAKQQLLRHANDAGLPLPAGRGTGEAFEWVVDLLRRRSLIKDCGEFPAVFHWLTLHVPPKGSASFTMENKIQKKGGVKLKLLGVGFGSGRAVTLSVKESFQRRTQCARLAQHIRVRVRSYDVGRGAKDPEFESRVTKVEQLEVIPWKSCPLCGKAPDELERSGYVAAGRGIDLRRDSVGQKREEVTALSVKQSADVDLPLKIPGFSDASVGLTAERNIELSCTMEYEFPPKAFFTPYVTAGQQSDLQCWAVK